MSEAHLISSRLPLIDITFSTSYFCFYFSSIFMIFSSSSLVVVFSSNHQHHHRLLARSLAHLTSIWINRKKKKILQLKLRNLTVNRISPICYYYYLRGEEERNWNWNCCCLEFLKTFFSSFVLLNGENYSLVRVSFGVFVRNHKDRSRSASKAKLIK